MAAPRTPCTELFRSHDGIQVLVIALRIVPRQSVYERGIGLCEDDFGVTCVYENFIESPPLGAVPARRARADPRARRAHARGAPAMQNAKKPQPYDSRFFSSAPRHARPALAVTLERNRDARRRLDMRKDAPTIEHART